MYWLLFLSTIMLAVGPALIWALHQGGSTLKWLERALLWLVTALVVVEIIPESIEHGGWWVLAAVAGGWLLPTFFERRWHRLAKSVDLVPMAVAMFGLVLHGTLDGLAIALPGGTAHALSWVVIVHRIPDSLLIWLLLQERGWRMPTLALAIVGVATIGGFFLGQTYVDALESLNLIAWFEAVVAGSLLHLAGHQHSGPAPGAVFGKCDCHHASPEQ